MSTLRKLKAAKTRADLAKFLGFLPSGLTYTLYTLPATTRYREFSIPKKSGGQRVICAPNSHLKMLQSHLASRLQECLRELEFAQPNRTKVTHGFQAGRSIVTNAEQHTNRRYVLNIDLKDFFDSINFGRIRGFFQKDRNFNLCDEVATTIAQIASWRNGLPQGSPASPVISNLIGHILDIKLLRLAKRAKCRYTRYADDITLSTNARDFPSAVATRDSLDASQWILSPEFLQAFTDAGFQINPAKTRMQIKGSRQIATGLLVNKKVNVKPEYYRLTRAMCHQLFKTGSYSIPSAPQLAKHRIDRLEILEGRLSFIYAIKARTDLDADAKALRGIAAPKSLTSLYQSFLFYKYFIANHIPTIVTEGPTDIVYLRSAIRQRAAKFPLLWDKSENQKLRVRLTLPLVGYPV